jgi:hypothetical protein
MKGEFFYTVIGVFKAVLGLEVCIRVHRKTVPWILDNVVIDVGNWRAAGKEKCREDSEV